MPRHTPFKRKIFVSLLAVSLIPVGLGVLSSWLATREVLSGLGRSGPWAQVGASGGDLLDRLQPYAQSDPILARAAARHREQLAESVRFARIYEAVFERFLRLVPLLVLAVTTLAVVLATAASRRLARGLSRPVEELVGWTERIRHAEPLPPDPVNPRGDTAEIVLLRNSLRGMAADLAQARRREVESARLRSWSSLARRVAHELKNPLTPIRFAATQIARREDPQLREAGAVILEEVRRLDEMARSFSQLGKLPEGPPSAVDLEELVRALSRSHTTDSLPVAVENQCEDPVIQGHYDALERVFRNLLANALEAMEEEAHPGGIRISIRPAPRAQVEVEVRDHGPGIPVELEKDLWSAHFTSKRRGTGLGLALVRQTVELHGGSVTAANAPDGGAVFRVRLPREPLQAIPASP